MNFNGRQIQLVAGLHGNERAPVRALESLGKEFILGNPEAFSRNVRFIDEDINASFGLKDKSQESRRAQELLELIPPESVVIDFHTTSALSEPFVILTDAQMIPLAERTGCTYAVLMTHNIKEGHALINHRDGISVEISGYDTPEAYAAAKLIIESLESGVTSPITVLEVFGTITESGDYTNFIEHSQGFIPVLVGEESYDVIGLKARLLTKSVP